MKFMPMSEAESASLREALKDNAERGLPLHMDSLTTGWMPGADEIQDDEVISAIKSIPTHY